MNKPSAWLEISLCIDLAPAKVIEESLVRKLPVLYEVLVAGQGASAGKDRVGVWEYCRKLSEQESQDVKESIVFESTVEDARSVVQSVNLSYNNTCYTIRLFVEK